MPARQNEVEAGLNGGMFEFLTKEFDRSLTESLMFNSLKLAGFNQVRRHAVS